MRYIDPNGKLFWNKGNLETKQKDYVDLGAVVTGYRDDGSRWKNNHVEICYL